MDSHHTGEPTAKQVSGVRDLQGLWPWLPRLATLVLTVLTLDYVLNLGYFSLVTAVESQFLYTVVALMVPLVFIMWPAFSGGDRRRVAWYDVLLFLLAVGTCGYFVYNAERILDNGWEYAAPDHGVWTHTPEWGQATDSLSPGGRILSTDRAAKQIPEETITGT